MGIYRYESRFAVDAQECVHPLTCYFEMHGVLYDIVRFFFSIDPAKILYLLDITGPEMAVNKDGYGAQNELVSLS